MVRSTSHQGYRFDLFARTALMWLDLPLLVGSSARLGQLTVGCSSISLEQPCMGKSPFQYQKGRVQPCSYPVLWRCHHSLALQRCQPWQWPTLGHSFHILVSSRIMAMASEQTMRMQDRSGWWFVLPTRWSAWIFHPSKQHKFYGWCGDFEGFERRQAIFFSKFSDQVKLISVSVASWNGDRLGILPWFQGGFNHPIVDQNKATCLTVWVTCPQLVFHGGPTGMSPHVPSTPSAADDNSAMRPTALPVALAFL